MYTGIDVLIIVIATMAVMAIIALILLACLTVNSQEQRELEAYMEGYLAGQVEKIKGEKEDEV